LEQQNAARTKHISEVLVLARIESTERLITHQKLATAVLNTSSLKGSFKLRFVHRGTPLKTALTSLIAKLKHGSATRALVGAQAATPTRGHVID
jgi:hypothetical protein